METGVLREETGDDWATWDFFPDVVPREPDVPPPPLLEDMRDREVEAPLPVDRRGWRWMRRKRRY